MNMSMKSSDMDEEAEVHVLDPWNEEIRPFWAEFLKNKQVIRPSAILCDEFYVAIQPYEAQDFLVYFPEENIYEAFEGACASGQYCIVSIAMVANDIDRLKKDLTKIGVNTDKIEGWSQEPHLEVTIKATYPKPSKPQSFRISDKICFIYDADKMLRVSNVSRRVYTSKGSMPGDEREIPEALAEAVMSYVSTHVIANGRSLSIAEASKIESHGFDASCEA